MSDDETAERMIKSLQTHIKGVVGSEGFSTVSCSPSCPFRILPWTSHHDLISHAMHLLQ